MNEFSKRILSAVEESGLSYGELSKLTGIPKSALQRYATGETSKVPIDRIEKIAKFTNVSASYLMGWDTKKETLEFNKTNNRTHFSDEVSELLNNFNKLNSSGKKEAKKRVQELTYIPFYCSDKNSNSNVPELFAASAEDRSPEKIALMESEFDDFDDI